jgi:hypothetical protein
MLTKHGFGLNFGRFFRKNIRPACPPPPAPLHHKMGAAFLSAIKSIKTSGEISAADDLLTLSTDGNLEPVQRLYNYNARVVVG